MAHHGQHLVTGIMMALQGFGSGASGGTLTATIQPGVFASDFNNSAWTFPGNTCTVVGGTPPYTYSWAWSSTSGGSFTFVGSSGTSATCTPRVTGVAIDVQAQGTLTCTVTDSASSVDTSNAVIYQYENFGA